MDKRITIGDKIDLKKIDKRLSADLDKVMPNYISQVLDEAENGDLLVAMPVYEGRVIPLNVGDEYDTTFYTKSGLLNCRTVVTGRYKKGALFLLALSTLSELKKIQRREYFRLNCRNPLKYRVLGEDERNEIEKGNTYDIQLEEDEWKNGIMLDLSGGGIRFVSAFRDEKDVMLQVRFEFVHEGNPIMVYSYAQLLRCEVSENNKSIYDHRIKFFHMDRNVRESIIKYIFDIQRQMRVKESGMK